jgi:hypothetical protein
MQRDGTPWHPPRQSDALPENHEHAIAIHFMHYNFVCRHQSLRVTPAMKAKVTDHLWSIEEIVSLAD